MPGWTIIADVPPFTKAGLGAADVKVAHKFTTGLRAVRRHDPCAITQLRALRCSPHVHHSSLLILGLPCRFHLVHAYLGWFLGNYKGKRRAPANDHNVWYPNEVGSTSGIIWTQKLLAEDYGINGMWVAVRRDHAATAALRREAAAVANVSGAAEGEETGAQTASGRGLPLAK